MIRWMVSLTVVLACGAIVGCASVSNTSRLLMLADFETGDVFQMHTQKASTESISVVTSPVRAGKYAAKTLLRADDAQVNRGQRAEFSEGSKSSKVFLHRDYWYGLSIFLPQDFVAPQKGTVVLMQWHTQKSGPSPVLAIRVQGDAWLITTNATGHRREIARIPYEKSKWTDWVVHAKWADTPTGFWRIWKDGVEVVSEMNVVTQYPETMGPYVKFGQYHTVEDVQQNIVYVDEFRMAGAGAGYQAVAPGVAP